jgi:hypothetical protein
MLVAQQQASHRQAMTGEGGGRRVIRLGEWLVFAARAFVSQLLPGIGLHPPEVRRDRWQNGSFPFVMQFFIEITGQPLTYYCTIYWRKRNTTFNDVIDPKKSFSPPPRFSLFSEKAEKQYITAYYSPLECVRGLLFLFFSAKKYGTPGCAN